MEGLEEELQGRAQSIVTKTASTTLVRNADELCHFRMTFSAPLSCRCGLASPWCYRIRQTAKHALAS